MPSLNGTSTPRSLNAAYRVLINAPTQRVRVLADLPEQFHITTQAQYTSWDLMIHGGPTPAGIAQAVVSDALGGYFMWEGATKQIFNRIEPLDFSLSLQFDAETNAEEDVHKVAIKLQSLVLPTYAFGTSGPLTGVLKPPNPWRIGSDNQISLRIGRQFYFNSVILVSVSYTPEMRLSKRDGFPIAGQVDVNFRTDYALSRDEYLQAAGYGPAATSGPYSQSGTDAALGLDSVNATPTSDNG